MEESAHSEEDAGPNYQVDDTLWFYEIPPNLDYLRSLGLGTRCTRMIVYSRTGCDAVQFLQQQLIYMRI